MHPPYSDEFQDIYFSAEDGLAETRHVFLNGNRLPERFKDSPRFTICETGFGTGLNFFAAWQTFEETAKSGDFLNYISFEKYPLTPEKIRAALSPWAHGFCDKIEQFLAQYIPGIPGEHIMYFNRNVRLLLIQDDVNDALPKLNMSVDAWFLDGFAPAKNPDMWGDTLFQNMKRLSATDASVATFTAAGIVKRGLESAGYAVTKTKGYGRKRDMLVGTYAHTKPEAVNPPTHIHIAGAGLAGASAAYFLKKHGIDCTVYEQNNIASGASGNSAGMYNPRLSALRSAEANFYMAAYALARRTYAVLEDIDHAACGALHLATSPEKYKRYSQTIKNWNWSAEEMQFLDAEKAALHSGLGIDAPGLWLPHAGQVNPRKVVERLLEGMDVRIGMPYPADADVPLILANGHAASTHPAAAHLALKSVRGQMITFDTTMPTQRANIHYSGYLSAPYHGRQAAGATFQPWLDHAELIKSDTDEILANVKKIVPDFAKPETVEARAALRCSSKDHFPVIGKLAENVYISSAHGSHGLVSALYGGAQLAAYIALGDTT